MSVESDSKTAFLLNEADGEKLLKAAVNAATFTVGVWNVTDLLEVGFCAFKRHSFQAEGDAGHLSFLPTDNLLSPGQEFPCRC